MSKLKDFPHLFQLDYSELTHARIKSIHDRLRREQNDPFKSTAGDIRDLNFTAFILFLINDIDNAIQLTETVLNTTEGGNLVALGNMAVMLWLKRNRADGEKYAERLQNLKETCEKSEFEANVARGKAEIAYCYSRMGMAFAARAVDVYEEVVHQIPEEYSWKFGLALVLRRFTHLNYRAYYQVTAKTSREQNMKAFELLQEITNCASVPDLKAHAWAELGMLLGQPWNAELKDVSRKAQDVGLTAQYCFEEAIRCAPKNVDVLIKSGKFFTTVGDLRRSRALLEKGTKIRETSTGHHYLGNTFRKLAMNTGGERTQLESRRKTQGQRWSPESSARGSRKDKQVPVNTSKHNRPRFEKRYEKNKPCEQKHGYINKKTNFQYSQSSRSDPVCQETSYSFSIPGEDQSGARGYPELPLENVISRMSISDDRQEHVVSSLPFSVVGSSEARAIKAIVKSPRRLRSLRWDQEYVKDAECHFLKAIELSHGENTAARFDLGLMYFALGECQLALEQFSTITSQDECCLSPLQFINAYEQSGLVYLMLSSNAKDEPEKEKHLSVARTMLHRALEMQCDLVKELPKCLPDVKYIWSSFHTLCRAAQRFRDRGSQLKEQKHLMRMIGDFGTCLQVLKEMSKLSPQEASNPEVQETMLQCYLRLGQFDEAISLLNLLETTENPQEQFCQWTDPHLPVRVRIMAATNSLLNAGDAKASFGAQHKRYFLGAFRAKFSYFDQHKTQKKCVDNGCGEEQNWWHVMILHEPEDRDMEAKGLAIKQILRDVCGLRVTCMSDEDDVRPYHDEDSMIIQNAENSIVLLVMSGPQEPSKFFVPFLRQLPTLLLDKRTDCKEVMNLLIDNGQRLLELKCEARCLDCPPALLHCSDLRNPDAIYAICELFCFLVNISITSEYPTKGDNSAAILTLD